jgi:hypothetical protein
MPFGRFASAALVAALLALPAHAGDCRPVHGFYSSMPAPEGCASPVGFCTAGDLIGGLQGTYAFVMSTLTPAEPPGVVFYTGTSVVHLRSGDVYATDAGAIDLGGTTGRQSALLTITGGTGAEAGATGYLQLLGELGVTGAVQGEYWGLVCTP